jgi:hypothetical protein
MKTCPDCGERVYNLGCTNCNEEAYIEEQDMLTELQYPAPLPQPAPAPQKGEQEISDPMTNPTSPGELPIETEIYGVLDTLAITCGHSEAQALARYIRERIAREAAALLTEQSRQPEAAAWQIVKRVADLSILFSNFDVERQIINDARALVCWGQPKEPR